MRRDSALNFQMRCYHGASDLAAPLGMATKYHAPQRSSKPSGLSHVHLKMGYQPLDHSPLCHE
jgi:hypothetical protein